jgi:hypothetical protein
MAETCVQGRGVLIDLHARVGRERVAVGYDLLMSIMEADGVVVESGDMVCLHTGFGQLLLEMGRKPDPESMSNACAVLNGRVRSRKRHRFLLTAPPLRLPGAVGSPTTPVATV